MKKILFLLAIILFCTPNVYSQMTFSMSPGSSFNSASFGYKLNKFVPFIGIQHAGANLDVVTEFKEFDYNIGAIVNQKITTGIKASILMPNIGTKYFFIEQGKLKAYGSINLAMPFLSTKLDLGDDDLEDDINEAISKIRLIAGELSFGSEYFFSHQFSLAGEFGIRYINFSYNQSFDNYVYDPNIGQSILTTASVDGSLTFNPTFSKLSLNFYFGANTDN